MRGNPVDIGNACRRGISHYISTGGLCVPPAEENGGNGAAMRNLPTVLVSLASEELLVQRSLEQAHLTHNHPQSDAATAALARMTRRLLLEGEQAAVQSNRRQPDCAASRVRFQTVARPYQRLHRAYGANGL